MQNEQSIVLRAEELGPQQIQMVKRVYPGGLNLLNYSNMRMFVHGEGYRDDSKSDRGRKDAELVIRNGNRPQCKLLRIPPAGYLLRILNYPTPPIVTDGGRGVSFRMPKQVWLYDENSMNVVLAAFNEIKQLSRAARDYGHQPSGLRLPLMQEGDACWLEGATVAIKGNPFFRSCRRDMEWDPKSIRSGRSKLTREPKPDCRILAE
ncbi:hypothetical protein [Rhodohalobacter sp.]|uniref:hypothetical protein n=1 Tax=Rhodohalobacter sp. TaxID=1974210 RepID=UPI002ACF021C|nr:hypothetical protein [Rhodohalobacter sp.]MDZ7756053.1 hypothetical protein [Rhodohalobacter sp.]